MRIPIVITPAAALLWVGACLQSYDDFQFTGSSASGGSGATGGTTTSGGGGSGAQGGTAGSGAQQGGGGSAAAGGSGGSGGAGGQPGVIEVMCVTVDDLCDISAGNVCCLPWGGGLAECLPAQTGCGGNASDIYCDEPDDCGPNELCCGTFLGGPFNYEIIECAATCAANGEYILCDPNGPNICTPPDTCQPSAVLPQGYTVCR